MTSHLYAIDRILFLLLTPCEGGGGSETSVLRNAVGSSLLSVTVRYEGGFGGQNRKFLRYVFFERPQESMTLGCFGMGFGLRYQEEGQNVDVQGTMD